ncbi:condensation domain-containing protein [Actinokineospora sp. 24-640]
MSVEAPLNNGQLWSWRDVDRYPPAWRTDANLPVLWDLRGMPAAAVETALRRVTARHDALRTTYHLRDGLPVQRVRPTAVLPLEREDREITDYGDPDRVLAALAARPFAMTGELGWRGHLVSTGGAPMFLALVYSHLIVDVWSTHHIQDDFRALVADPDAPDPDGPSPRELAAAQRGPDWRPRQAESERYWRRVLTDDIGRCFPTLPHRAQRPRVELTLHSHRLGGLAARAARGLGVSAPSVLLACTVAALAHYLDTRRVTMSVMASNRFSPEHQQVVGTMNQLVPVMSDVDPDEPLSALVKRVHWASAKAYRHSCYDTDAIAAIAAEVLGPVEHDCWFNHLFRGWFNYLQLDREPADPAAETPAELVWTPADRAQPYGQPFRVRVAASQGRTSAILLADPEILPSAAAAGILRAMAIGARQAAADPAAPVSGLWRGAALEPALFPLHAVPV